MYGVCTTQHVASLAAYLQDDDALRCHSACIVSPSVVNGAYDRSNSIQEQEVFQLMLLVVSLQPLDGAGEDVADSDRKWLALHGPTKSRHELFKLDEVLQLDDNLGVNGITTHKRRIDTRVVWLQTRQKSFCECWVCSDCCSILHLGIEDDLALVVARSVRSGKTGTDVSSTR